MISINSSRLFQNFGLLVEPRVSRDLFTLDVPELMSLLAVERVLLLRGFNVDDDRFLNFTNQFPLTFMTHPSKRARQRVGQNETLLTAVSGVDRVPLHGEMYYLPQRPSTVFLFSSSVAASGGETRIVDAVEFFSKLPQNLRELFEADSLCYTNSFTRSDMRRLYGLSLFERSSTRLSDLGFSHVQCRGGVFNRTFQSEFIDSAIQVVARTGKKAFLNSILNKTSQTRFASGTHFSSELLNEIDELGESIAHDILWKPGDVLIFDNMSLMHGRRSFVGDRRILTRMGRPRV